MTLKVVFKRNEGETNSNLNLSISRTTRHGTTVLALPSRVFWMDLTLHMDIEANPGPEEDAVATRRESSLESYLNYYATTTIAYSRNQLLNLRSKYSLSQDLLRLLKNQKIFKSRRGRAGVSFRNKISNIPTCYRPKKDSRLNQVGSDLHNLKSLERLNVNKARSPVHPPEIIDSDRIQDSHGLKVLHLNIRSLRNSEHFIQLKELNKRGKFDVITISESWLNTSVSSLEVNLEGYKLSRLESLHMGGGGVCVYTRNNLKAKVLKDLSSISERNFYQLWISLQWKKTKSVIVCTTYRPDDCPLSAFEDNLKPTYMQALTLNKSIVILGDLNCDLRKACAESRALNNFSSEMNLQQLIKHPTRITATTKPLLDVILVSCPQSVRGSGVINYSISDHLPVFVEHKVKAPKPLPHYITERSYKNYEPGAFTTDLANQSDQLLSIFSCGDVDTKLNTLNDVVGSTLDLHAPVRTTRIRHRPCPFVPCPRAIPVHSGK